MGAPTSSATIEFPVSLIDTDIWEELKEEGVRGEFKGDSLDLDSPSYDMETEVEGGIFRLHNPEARYGEFNDLEELFMAKGIPFDRESGMDWNRPPERRVYRPAREGLNAQIDDYVDLNQDGEEVVTVAAIREVAEMGVMGAVKNYLNKEFPTYPPLTPWVKDEGAA